MDAIQTRFEQWYKENHGEHLMGKDSNGKYVTAHCQWVWEGFKGACDCVREHAKAKKGNIELLNVKFEKYWSERYSFELKRGHGCARSLRKVDGMYIATLTQEAWEHYQAFNE